MPEGAWELVNTGDMLYDNIRNQAMGTVVAVDHAPYTRPIANASATHVYQSPVPKEGVHGGLADVGDLDLIGDGGLGLHHVGGLGHPELHICPRHQSHHQDQDQQVHPVALWKERTKNETRKKVHLAAQPLRSGHRGLGSGADQGAVGDGHVGAQGEDDVLRIGHRALIPEALEHMGKGALRIYRERFTGEIFARNIEAVYLRALEGENKE